MPKFIKGGFNKKDIGEMIVYIRTQRLGKTQDELVEEIGCAKSALIGAEKGTGNHTVSLLQKICEKYGLDAMITVDLE